MQPLQVRRCGVSRMVRISKRSEFEEERITGPRRWRKWRLVEERRYCEGWERCEVISLRISLGIEAMDGIAGR